VERNQYGRAVFATEAAVFKVIPAFPLKEFSTPVRTTAFIARGSTMVLIIPEVFSDSSTRDLTMAVLIRHFVCGGFTRDFGTRDLTGDFVTTVFIRDTLIVGFTAKRMQTSRNQVGSF
jgi:hypothetical protein